MDSFIRIQKFESVQRTWSSELQCTCGLRFALKSGGEVYWRGRCNCKGVLLTAVLLMVGTIPPLANVSALH